MKPYDKDSLSYLQKLSYAVMRDPASMEHWQCLHVSAPEGTSIVTPDKITAVIDQIVPDAEGDIVFCEDNDVLIIARHLDLNTLHDMASQIHHAMQGDHTMSPLKFHVYDLFTNWRDFLSVMLAKAYASRDGETMTGTTPEQIKHLTDLFAVTREQRGIRKRLQVLLVEDDPITRRIATNVLKERYGVVTAVNGEEAINHYLTHAPDIVFLDIELPDRNGLDILRQLRAYDPEAYIVMFSGNSYLENVTEALNIGAKGFVAKPFVKEKLFHYVQQCCPAKIA